MTLVLGAAAGAMTPNQAKGLIPKGEDGISKVLKPLTVGHG